MPCYVRRKSIKEAVGEIDTPIALLLALGIAAIGGLIAFFIFKPGEKQRKLTSSEALSLYRQYQERVAEKGKASALDWLKGLLGVTKVAADVYQFVKSEQAKTTTTTAPTTPTTSPGSTIA